MENSGKYHFSILMWNTNATYWKEIDEVQNESFRLVSRIERTRVPETAESCLYPVSGLAINFPLVNSRISYLIELSTNLVKQVISGDNYRLSVL